VTQWTLSAAFNVIRRCILDRPVKPGDDIGEYSTYRKSGRRRPWHCIRSAFPFDELDITMAKSSTPLTLDRLDTPIGIALLVTNHDGALCALDWIDYESRLTTLLRRYYGAVELTEKSAPSEIRTALARYFDGDLGQLNGISCHIPGTPFQSKIWTALRAIPAGTTLSYGTLAAQLGAPTATRAVGHANGANPLSVVVPCHRLIGANGALTGYGGGIARKRWLLAHEGVVVK
jgi:methylated-DNA-[protein]-cysteine S-methyltransferase